MFKKLAAVTALLAGTIAVPVLSAGSATAGPAGSGNFCSFNVETQKMVCVATEAELVGARAQAARNAVTPLATYTIAKLYDNANYDASAGVLEVTAGASCTTSRSNIDSSIADLGGWRNRISSFQGFANCAVKLFENTNWGGSAYPGTGYYVSSTNVGAAMNDQAESVRFS